MKNKMYILFITVVILIFGFVFGAEWFHRSEIKRLSFLSQRNSAIFVRPYAPVKGEESATVFVTEFLDPECESCRGMASFVNKLLEDYKGKIKIVIRYRPLHRNSIFAIKILEATRKQGKYWEALDLLFRYQPNWGNHHAPRPELIWDYLPEIGLDIDRIKADMESAEIAKILEQDALDAQKLQVRGTPTFFVNGKPLAGHGAQYLRDAIDNELR